MNVQTNSTYLAFSLCLFLTGCGTQYAYHQTESDIQEIKGLSLDTFIREKIVDSDPIAVKGVISVFEPLSKVVSMVKGGKSIHEKIDYRKKNFIFRGLFDYRYHALTKPKKDLALFCRANGGTLQNRRLNKVNLASGSVLEPSHAYMIAMRSHTNGMESEIKITPDISIPLHVSKEQMAVSYAEMIDTKNRQSGIYDARESISKAISEESFGEFSCVKDESDIWSVNIMPLVLQSQNEIKLGSPFYVMYIGVVPLNSEEELIGPKLALQ